jgi:GNAT superfamily N-acetyltransferase
MIIRPLTLYEREAARSFYLALTPDDRRKRFCCTNSDETISKYVDRLNFTRDTVLAAFDDRANIIGLAELVRGPKESEMAFSVRPDRRGQKIGTSLLEKLMLRARMCGVRKVFVMFLPDNTPMRKMAMRAGMKVSTIDGEAHAVRELPAPSADELSRWFIEEGFAHGEYFGTLGLVRWDSLLNRPASNTTPQSPKSLAPAA